MTRGQDATVTRQRLVWAIALRAMAASLLLGSAILLRVRTPGGQDGTDVYFLLIAATYALTGIYAASVRFVERWPWIADLHFAGDVVLVSALVLLTGGTASVFTSLYALPVVAAGAVQLRRGGLATAALASLAYAAVVIAPYAGVAKGTLPGTALAPPGDVSFLVVTTAAGLVAVGLLTGWLAEGWHRADQRLAHASSAIADLQAFNDRIVDSLPGGLVTTTPDGLVTSANRAAVSITGCPADQLVGQPVSAVLQLPPQQAVPPGPADRWRTEYEFTRPSGQRIVLGLSVAPITTEGAARGFLFTFQDVTEHRRREIEAQRQKRLAAIGEMAAGIAHEIRNPLASMAGAVQVLRRDLVLEAQHLQLMDIVLRESQRLDNIIRDFLVYARPQRPARQPLDLGRVVTETAALLRHGQECGPGHRVEVEVDEHAPACLGDENQIRQVLWNLCINGLRAMPEGGLLTIRLEAAPTREAGTVSLVVADTGVGMTPEQQEALFQPFRSSFARGTGLGLAIAHRIVSDHGGAIDVDSAPGRGTTVRVTLPMAGFEDLAAVPAADTRPAHAA